MMSFRGIAVACVTVALAAVPRSAGAQLGPRSQDTFFTFSQPVELPNATLPAGSYLFQLADSPSNRHIVRVMSRDRQKLFTTVMAIPAYTLDSPPDEPQIRFMETPAGGPNVIRIWFYPGRSTGHEFVYPRSQAVRLAKATGEPVLTTKSESDVSKAVSDDDLTRVDRDGRDVAADMSGQRDSGRARTQSGTMQAETTASAAQSAPPSRPQAATPETATGTSGSATDRSGTAGRPTPAQDTQSGAMAATAATGDTNRRTSLPRTASTAPLLTLFGVTALAGGLWLHRRRAHA